MLVGLAVGAANPILSTSDRLLSDALVRSGSRTSCPRWNVDPLDDFLACDVVVLRGTWDYQEAPSEFASWIRALERAGGKVFNRGELAVWNNDKRHIMELAAKGIAVPATVELGPGSWPRDVARELGGDVIVKPAWGGDGVGVRRANPDNIDAVVATIGNELPGRPLMAQVYVPQIEHGEYSLVFIAGQFAHAVLKQPAAGEFRVNSRYGGTRTRIEPPERLIGDAAGILAMLPDEPLYARVDGVIAGDRLLCTEVELTDPSLYFDLAPESAQMLASATLATL